MKKDYTIVGPQMSPIHMSLVESVIRSGGYKFDILKTASREDVELGLKYVNNDACYPAIMVIGQLVDAIVKGKYDPDHVALAITQTGGMCRATNYFGLIRKALIDAGYPQVPVIALSTQGFEGNPGFKATPTLLHRAIKALVVGDLLLKCLMRVRPYEVEKGSADKLYQMWDTIVRETIEHHGFSDTAKKKIGKHYLPYQTLLKEIVKSFDALPLRDIPRKVRVGVVGEILRQVPSRREQPRGRRHRIAGLRGRGSRHHGVHDHASVHHRLEREEPRHGRQQEAVLAHALGSRSLPQPGARGH